MKANGRVTTKPKPAASPRPVRPARTTPTTTKPKESKETAVKVIRGGSNPNTAKELLATVTEAEAKEEKLEEVVKDVVDEVITVATERLAKLMEETKVEDLKRRRSSMSQPARQNSIPIENRRRSFSKRNSEVQIEEILQRVFEDVVVTKKPECNNNPEEAVPVKKPQTPVKVVRTPASPKKEPPGPSKPVPKSPMARQSRPHPTKPAVPTARPKTPQAKSPATRTTSRAVSMQKSVEPTIQHNNTPKLVPQQPIAQSVPIQMKREPTKPRIGSPKAIKATARKAATPTAKGLAAAKK